MPRGGYRAQPGVSTLGTLKIKEFALKLNGSPASGASLSMSSASLSTCGVCSDGSSFIVHLILDYLVPECQRLQGIIKRVISTDKKTSAPSKIIPSSANNLTIWYCIRAPISYRSRLFGYPGHHRTPHNYRYYDKGSATSPPILFLLDYDSFGV
jgi:hypothetical protein